MMDCDVRYLSAGLWHSEECDGTTRFMDAPDVRVDDGLKAGIHVDGQPKSACRFEGGEAVDDAAQATEDVDSVGGR
jgi:hypothetical protein